MPECTPVHYDGGDGMGSAMSPPDFVAHFSVPPSRCGTCGVTGPPPVLPLEEEA